ncbi:DMT family transporter [Burkholderia perseverans]|uniref:DMT family transporter n=1 Tax=Burkholderia perseverans TaxID=2615214 RepID=UPI001FEFA5B3|nr:DMT family transporter [Burkholderia perseverans]
MRKAVDGRAVLVMVALCMTWSLQQVAVKASAADAAPIFQLALRSGVAAALVFLYARVVARDRWLTGRMLPAAVVVGSLFALEFLFVAQGLIWTSASHMVVFLYTAPLFAALGLHLRLPDERMSLLQWSGMGLAFLGVAIAFLVPAWLDHGPARTTWMLGDLLGLGGAAAWGMTTVAVRTSRMSEAPATQTLFYQLAGAFVILLPAAMLLGQTRFHASPMLWTSLIFQTVFVCFVSFLVWFTMLRRYLAARLGVLSFMTPLFGVVWGVVLLNEQLSAAFMVGAVLVCVGLVVVNGEAWIVQWRERV